MLRNSKFRTRVFLRAVCSDIDHSDGKARLIRRIDDDNLISSRRQSVGTRAGTRMIGPGKDVVLRIARCLNEGGTDSGIAFRVILNHINHGSRHAGFTTIVVDSNGFNRVTIRISAFGNGHHIRTRRHSDRLIGVAVPTFPSVNIIGISVLHFYGRIAVRIVAACVINVNIRYLWHFLTRCAVAVFRNHYGLYGIAFRTVQGYGDAVHPRRQIIRRVVALRI